jgi:polyhydroxybutyrate depolymerase
MMLKRCPSEVFLVAFAAVALCVSCTSAENPLDDGDDTLGGSGGASGAAMGGTTANGGTTSNGGTTADGGTTSNGGATADGGTTSNGGTTASGGVSGVSGAAGASGGSDNGGSGMGGAPAGSGGSGAGMGGGAGSASGGTAGAAGGGGDAVAPSSGCGKAPTIMSGRASIDVNGKMREYIIAVPSNYDMNKPYRLVFGWHPWGGSAQQIAQQGYFGLSTAANGQAILVAPEGQDYQENGLGWGNVDGEDIAFAHAMMDRFGAGLCVDQNRMFSTGFSFGAMFSFTLACTEMSRMRAIAPEAGNATTSGRCEQSTRSVATMAFIGVDDSLLSGHRSAVQIFVDRNGCSDQTMPVTPSWCDGVASNFEPCSCVQYQGCKTGYPVVECEYKAGHQFAPTAGAALWSFFSQF